MIELKNVTKTYKTKQVETQALRGIDLHIDDGEMLAVTGPSGSGKTTLLNIIGGMDVMTGGSYMFNGQEMNDLSGKKLFEFRKENVSFIFQHFELMDDYTVYENVSMPLIASGCRRKEIAVKTKKALEMTGIIDLKDKFPPELSGGQQQRTAIARAIVNNNNLILADEPTGALDAENSKNIMELLKNLKSHTNTIIIITHDPSVASQCDRIVNIKDGRIV